MSGHAQITCTAAEATGFAVQVGNKRYPCNRTGEVVDISETISGGRVTGSIICPSYQDVCTVSVFTVVAIILISIRYSLFSIQHSAFSIQHSAFSIQHSAFSIQHSAFSIQHSAFSIQHSAFSIQHSAFSIQHSAFSIQYSVFSGYVSLFITHYYYCHYYILSSSLSS